MVRVYYLQVDTVGDTEIVRGHEYIHNAILGVQGSRRKLTQDTTPEEHKGLCTVATKHRKPTEKELALFAQLPEVSTMPPLRDLAAEIDALSAKVDALYKRNYKEVPNGG